MLEEYEAMIPQRRRIIEQMADEEKSILTKCQHFQEQLRTMDLQIIKLEMKKEEIEQSIVNADDYDALQLKKKELNNEYEELKAVRESNQKSNVDINAKIKDMDEFFKLVGLVDVLLKNENFEALR